MFDTLSKNDLAKLHARFVVPVVIDSMLRDEEALDDVAEYAMNQIIDELRPDTALLCLALCCQRIAPHIDHVVLGKTMQLEADKIVGEYGPLWLAHESGRDNLNEQAIRDLIVHIPEDLESLADLLDNVIDTLEEYHSVPAILCDILSVQARIHKENAELELQFIGADTHKITRKSIESDNVIDFPLHLRFRQNETAG